MKKSIIVSLILFLIMTTFMGYVNAASATVNVVVNNANPTVGSTITVTVSFSQPVGTANLNLNYNSSVVQYIGSNAWKATNKGSSIKLEYIDTDFENKTITSMTATFKVITTGTVNFTVSNVVISDAKGSELTASISGSAVVNAKQDTPADTNQTPSLDNNNSNGNANTKPSTNQTTKPNTNTNSNSNTNTNTTTQKPTVDNTEVSNSAPEIVPNENDNNEINNTTNVEQNREIQNNIDSENKDNSTNYMTYIIIGIIAIAIIIVIIVICKIKNNG